MRWLNIYKAIIMSPEIILIIIKPSWEDAPEWANWLAMDSNGEWHWYEGKPATGKREWLANKDKWYVQPAKSKSYQWRDTLEERPND